MSNAERTTGGHDVRPPRVINPKTPQPPGQVISPDRLTPVERELLLAAGVDCSQPIPDDLSERVQMDLADLPEKMRLEAQSLADQLPPGFTLPSQDLQLRGEEETMSQADLHKAVERYTHVVQDLRSAASQAPQPQQPPALVPQQQVPQQAPLPRKAPNAIHQAIEAARQHGVDSIKEKQQFAGISPNIAEALRGMPEEQQDAPQHKQADTNATGAQAPAAVDPKEAEADAAARREAAQQELLTKIRNMVPAIEVDRYRESIITFSEYSRTFVLADGGVEIVFRDYGGEENDMLVLQEAIDRRKGRSPQHDLAAQLHNSNKYMLALCLVSITSRRQQTPLIQVPADYPLLSYLENLELTKLPGYNSDPDDTPLHAWAAYLLRYVLRGSIYSLMMQAFSTFLSDLEGMKRLARERDFF